MIWTLPEVDPAAVIESAAESILITTADLEAPGPSVVYVNPAFERMTGWTRAEIIGRSPRVLQGPRTDRALLAGMRRALAAGGAWEGSAINYRRDGSEFVMEWSIVPLRARDGAVRHYLAVQRDVTRRVTAEREAIDAREAAERAERARANLARYFSPRVVNLLAARDTPLGPVRRQTVAALFADLVGFTGMAERRSPEEVMQLLRDYYRRMEAIVFRHEGSLEKYIGDALLSVFGVPDPGPQDATNALRCGHAMLVELRRWNTERTERGEPPIAIGIGLHYGPAVLGDLGGERTMAFAVVGDTINTASRLQRLTRTLRVDLVAGEALVDAVRSEAARGVDTGGLLDGLVSAGGQDLSGRASPVRVWVCRSASARPGPPG